MSEDQDTEDIPGLPEENLDLANSQFTKRKKKAFKLTLGVTMKASDSNYFQLIYIQQ